MKLSPLTLEFVSKGLSDEAKRRWPWWPRLAWMIDLLLVCWHVQLLYWLFQSLGDL